MRAPVFGPAHEHRVVNETAHVRRLNAAAEIEHEHNSVSQRRFTQITSKVNRAGSGKMCTTFYNVFSHTIIQTATTNHGMAKKNKNKKKINKQEKMQRKDNN